MNDEWAKLWFECLLLNRDYQQYSFARDPKWQWAAIKDETHRAEVIAGLEAKHPQLKGMHQDFGFIPSGVKMGPDWFNEWLEPRRHLFMNSPRVISEARSGVNPGFVLIEFPLTDNPKAMAAKLEQLLQGFDAEQRAPLPRYQLHTKNGRPAEGFEKVRKALISKRVSKYRSKGIDHVTLFERFTRREIDSMGWGIDPKSRKQLQEEGTISEERFESLKVMFNRSRLHLKLLTANVIHGRFPDMTSVTD